MIKQLNIKNVGVDLNGETPEGYQHEDGLCFDENNVSWMIQENFDSLGEDILNKFPNTKNILDVGAGAGNLRRGLLKVNPDLLVVTLDGNKETINSPLVNKNTHFVLRTDVEYELVDENDVILKFDLICSFEHFEHIEPKFFDTFIDNIKRHSHKDTILIATAANWKYNNSNVHCNVKNEKEWEEELTQKYGMKKTGEKILNKENWSHRIKFCHELNYRIFK